MSSVWFLVIVLNTNGSAFPAVAIPQLNQAACISAKKREIARPEIKSADCIKGALPSNQGGFHERSEK